MLDTSAPVMVTGATGYVAGWIVRRLLEEGMTVHAPVRNPHDSSKLQHLNAIADRSPGTIRYFQADLLKDGSYADAMEGCSVVFHTASPFSTNVKNPQKDLVDPALLGTRNVLIQANNVASVRRVVVTSSCAAIYTDAIDTVNAPGGMLTEDIWNTTASLDYQPYSYSKTVAEQQAWTLAKAQDRWDLVTINPSLVLGPAIGGRPSSESFSIMRRAGTGEFSRGAPRIGIGVVDVRDVAEAHVKAAFDPGVSGRHIVSGHDTDIFSVVKTLEEPYGDEYPLPRRPLPRWLLWLVAPMVGMERAWVRRNANVPWHADNSKSIEQLGLEYRPLEDTTRDMFAYMIDQGYFDKG